MTSSDLVALQEISHSFVEALRACPREERPLEFQEFPHGACREASELLGIILEQQGFDVEIISGQRRSDGWTHVWLMVNGMVVDVTIGQFKRELVVLVTEDKSWHEQFESTSPARRPCFEIYDAEERPMLVAFFQQWIIPLLNRNQ